MATQIEWQIGQIVDVQPRTWAGINRPGGTGKIVMLHYAENDETEVEFIDVKYILYSSTDKNLRPHLLSPHEDVSRTKRRNEKPVKEKPEEKPQEKRKKRTALKRVSKNVPPRPSPAPTSLLANTKSSAVIKPRSPESVSTVSPSSTPAQATLSYRERPATSKPTSPESLSTVSPTTTGIKRAETSSPGGSSTSYRDGDECEAESLIGSCRSKDTPVKHRLEQVYKNDVRQAEEFVDELKVHLDEDSKSTMPDKEMGRFTSSLNELLLKNDGMLEVADIPSLLQDFPTDQVHAYVDNLCSQNKIMRTDGIIYTI